MPANNGYRVGGDVPTLYQLDRLVSDVIENGFSVDAETGEVLADFYDLDALIADLDTKLESCGKWMKNREALIEAMQGKHQSAVEVEL